MKTRDEMIEKAAEQIARDCGLTVCTDLFNAVETGAQLGAKWADANPTLDHEIVKEMAEALSFALEQWGYFRSKLTGDSSYIPTLSECRKVMHKYRAAVAGEVLPSTTAERGKA